jgi:hypothetical protein
MKNRSEQEAIFEDAAIEILAGLAVVALVAIGVWWLA